MRASPFDWTVGDRLEKLEQLYRREGGKAEAVALALGCSRRAVVNKAEKMGWGKERRARRKAERVKPYYGKERRSLPKGQLSDDQLIAQAMAAGRVRQVAPGLAAGLSYWERAAGRVASPIAANYRSFNYGGAGRRAGLAI